MSDQAIVQQETKAIADPTVVKPPDWFQSNELNWDNPGNKEVALLLTKKPIPVSGGGKTYLTLPEAMMFVLSAIGLGFKPTDCFTNKLFWDAYNKKAGVSYEGKQDQIRERGIDLGAPEFEEMKRPWTDIPRQTQAATDAQKDGFKFDYGAKAKIRVGKDHTTYVAWLSEWYVAKSAVWKEKPFHMLQLRAAEKATSFARGSGASAMPDEAELGTT